MYGVYPQEIQSHPVETDPLFPDSPTPIDHRDYCARPPVSEPKIPEAAPAPQEVQQLFYGYPFYPMGQPHGQAYQQMVGTPPGQQEEDPRAQAGLEAYYQQMYAQYYYQPEGQLVPQVQDAQQGYYYPASPPENPPGSVQEAPRQIVVKQKPLQL